MDGIIYTTIVSAVKEFCVAGMLVMRIMAGIIYTTVMSAVKEFCVAGTTVVGIITS
jgi:hypothetical protein